MLFSRPRRSEASALLWEDVEGQEDGSGRAAIRASKTDAEGRAQWSPSLRPLGGT